MKFSSSSWLHVLTQWLRDGCSRASSLMDTTLDVCASSSISTLITLTGASMMALTFRRRAMKRAWKQSRTEPRRIVEEPLLRSHEYMVLFYNRNSNRNMGQILAQWIPRYLGHNVHCFPLDPENVEGGIRMVDQLHQQTRALLQGSTPSNSTNKYGGSTGVKVVVAGGDGSVCWILQKLAEEHLSHIPCAIIPLGTGNDLSFVLGWGSQAPNLHDFLTEKHMRKWVRRLRAATVVGTDVWRVDFGVRADNDGWITQVKGGKAVKSSSKTESCLCVNYSSLGLDARLVYDVEMYRTSWRFLNKIIYAIAGAVRSLIPYSPVSSEIASLKLNGTPVDPFALGTLQNIIALSVPSYAGGVPLWKLAEHLDKKYYEKLYVRFPDCVANPDNPLPASQDTQNSSESNISQHRQSDGNFELVGAHTLAQLGAAVGCEKPVFGGVFRLARAESIYVEFLTGTTSPMYLQVDGEAYILHHPEFFEMKWEQQASLLRCMG